MKLSKKDLGVIFSMANQNYRDLDKNDLDDQQFTAKCWTMAVNEYVAKIDLEFPPRRLLEEPVDS